MSVAKMTTHIAWHGPNHNLLNNTIYCSTTVAMLTVSLFQDTEVQFCCSLVVVNLMDYSAALSSAMIHVSRSLVHVFLSCVKHTL